MAVVSTQSASRNIISDSARRASLGSWLLVAGAAVSFALAIFNYFWHGNGIHGTAGALLVVASTALMLAAFVVVAVLSTPSGLRGPLIVLIGLDIIGTGVAAFMLETYIIVAAMIFAAIGFVASIIRPQRMAVASAGAAAVVLVGAYVCQVSLSHAQNQPTQPSAQQPVQKAPQHPVQPPNEQPAQSPEQQAAAAPVIGATHYNDWHTFNGDLKNQKYSDAGQITPDNVAKLTKAWEVHTGDMSDGSGKASKSDWSATPLFVNNTVYVSTPFYRIFAIAPDTGKVKWTYDTHAILKAVTQPDLKTRGVAYWQAANPKGGKTCDKMVYVGTMEAKLYAVDADSGQPCEGFANKGVLDINQWNTTNGKWPLSILQPPTVYKDTLYIGWAGKDWADAEAPPGTIFAVDARTGALKWTFNALPEDIRKKTGTANVWASMSIDPEHGILYLPISSPSPNFYGGNRKEKIPTATSVTALNADTGELLWSRQIVHHDIWDYDTDAPPTLVDIRKDGKTVPALVQTSKMGFIFVLNRLTGEPIYPIEERKVPASDVAGEQAASTQPYPTGLAPTVPDKFPGISTIADIASFGQCSRTFDQLRHDGRYTPPSLKGTLAYPSTAGGIEWGGGAVDPTTGVYVVNSSAVAQIYKLMTRQDYDAADKGADPGDNGYYPQAGSPYGFYLTNFVNFLGMPCWKPPYGTMSAYDLNTGKLLWRKPFGVSQKWGFYMPKSWGSVTIGGPLVTKSGLIFVGGSMDARVRAIDLKTGEVLWRALVDAPAVANPATYTYNGKQYVVFVAGGNAILKPQAGDQVVAYALPG